MRINHKWSTATAIAFIACCWATVSYSIAESFESSAKRWEKYTSFGYESLRRGHYADAKLGFSAALKETEMTDPISLVPDVTKRRVESLNDLAEVYRAQGREMEAKSLYQLALKKIDEPARFYTRTIITNFSSMFIFLLAGIFEFVILDWHFKRTKQLPVVMWNVLWNILWIAVWTLLTAAACVMKEAIKQAFLPAIEYINLDIVSRFYLDPYQSSYLSFVPGWGVGQLSIVCCATISGATRAVLGCFFSRSKDSIGFYMLALVAAEILGVALLFYWEINVFTSSPTGSDVSGLRLPPNGNTNLAVRLMFLGYLKECFNHADLFLFQFPAIIMFFVWLQHRHEKTKRFARASADVPS